MINKKSSRLRRAAKTKAIIKSKGNLRLVVHRSSAQIYAQIVEANQQGDTVLVSCSTLEKSVRDKMKGTKIEQAYLVGQIIGERAKQKQITHVAFDRSGYKYHGRVEALAKGARESLTF